MKRRPIPWGLGCPATQLLGYAALLAVSLMLSCAKKAKEPEPDCGCDSKIVGHVTDGKARYAGEGRFYVIDEGAFEVTRIFSACKIDPKWTVSKQGVTDYVISGDYKEQCLLPNTSPPFVSTLPIDLTKLILPKK